MKCVICKNGKTQRRATSVTLERGGLTMVFKGVPAEVCDNCGEAYIDESASARLLTEAEKAASAGISVDVRDYSAA